jgi:hypothetical protein
MRQQHGEIDDDWSDEELDWIDESLRLAGVLGDTLDESYADADPVELAEELDELLDSMSDAEALSFTNVLRQLASEPTIARIASKAVPLGASALGTAFAGPAGMAIGRALGNTAVKGLGGGQPAGQNPATSSGKSSAAVQGLALVDQLPIKAALVRAAMGKVGQQDASIMRLLSSVFGEAAADADELQYLGAGRDDGESPPEYGDLYSALVNSADCHEGCGS